MQLLYVQNQNNNDNNNTALFLMVLVDKKVMDQYQVKITES